MEQEFIRAHGDQQKAVRIDQIIRITLQLYEEIGYDKITFSKIAERLNFSRINLYNYFSTKEEIFLEILRRDSTAFLDDALDSFGEGEMELDDFVWEWARLILRHGRVVELYVLMNMQILRHVPKERHMDFQNFLDELFGKMRAPVQRIFPSLSEENTRLFVAFQINYAMGLHPIVTRATQAGITRETDEEQFMARYTKFLYIVLRGLL